MWDRFLEMLFTSNPGWMEMWQKRKAAEQAAREAAARQLNNEPFPGANMMQQFPSDSGMRLEDLFRMNPRYQGLMQQWDQQPSPQAMQPNKQQLWNMINSKPPNKIGMI